MCIIFRGFGISSGRQQRMAADVVFQETNAVLNSFWGGQEENAVTPRRGHYQLYGPQTRILLKDFFFVNGFRMRPGRQ